MGIALVRTSIRVGSNMLVSINGQIFVRCHSRLGTVTIDGPVTGKVWAIPVSGVWIDEEDEELVGLKKNLVSPQELRDRDHGNF